MTMDQQGVCKSRHCKLGHWEACHFMMLHKSQLREHNDLLVLTYLNPRASQLP